MNPGESTEALERSGGFSISASRALTPLTGRDTEVGLLIDRWEQAHEGMGQVVLIVGEPGLGKSRLVQTIKERLFASSQEKAGSPIIDWYCSQRFQDSGLRPVAHYFERLLDLDPAESCASRFDRMAQYFEDCGLGRKEIVGLIAKLLFLPPDDRFPAPTLTPVREREETFRAVHEWLRARSCREPVLFIVEDLHWIDPSTLEFLKQFIGIGLHDRILTVLTCRPEFQYSWPVAAHQTSIALNRLTRRQVAELMRKEIGLAPPDSLVAQIYERTGGVPLLVEEFTAMVRESGKFDKGGASEIPGTLQQLVMDRLARMSSNREVAYFAAALGREFDYEMLAAITGEDEQLLQAELEKLVGTDILRAKGSPPDSSYVFKHDLLEEALRNAPEAARKREIHRRVAEVLEARFSQLAETQPELLALHYTEAGLVEKAVCYWLKAGRRSQERSANIEAIGHLTKGMELLGQLDESPARDSSELEMLRLLGTASIAAHGYAAPEVGPIFQRARTLSERVIQTPEAFVTIRGQFAFHIVRGELPICTELAAQAMELAGQNRDTGLLMEALFLQGLTMLYRGDFTGAHDCCALALTEYDDRARTAFWAAQTGEDSGVTHRCYLALALWYLGFPDRAVAMNKEARELARSLHHPFSIEYALHHTGWLFQNCGQGVDTYAAGEEEVRIATEQGFLFWHATGTLYYGAGLLLSGRLEEGLQQFQKGLDAYRATGAGLALTYYLGILGEAFTQSGRLDDARQVLEEALAFTEKHGERFHEAELHRLRGELHLAQEKDEAAAEASFSRAIGVAQSQRSRALELRATVSLARLWHRRGRRNDAFAALTAIFGAFAEGSIYPDLIDAAAVLKELGDERIHDDLAAAIKYVRDCIPAPIDGLISIDWRYIPSSTLGGDTMGYHWIDAEHLAMYLIDVTGHGLDSAMLSVTINNVIRSSTISGADPRRSDQVLAALNRAFQGSQHGQRYFTIWYGVYQVSTRTLTYASGGHPPAIVVLPGEPEHHVLSATGTIMGMLPEAEFPVRELRIPADAQLFIFSDGVFEIRRDKRSVWDLSGCIAYITSHSKDDGFLENLVAHVRGLQGSALLSDDFSIISGLFH